MVEPHGAGKTADFSVVFNRDGEGREFTFLTLTLTATDPFAGFIRLRSDTYSSFKSPCNAPNLNLLQPRKRNAR